MHKDLRKVNSINLQRWYCRLDWQVALSKPWCCFVSSSTCCLVVRYFNAFNDIWLVFFFVSNNMAFEQIVAGSSSLICFGCLVWCL